MSKLKKKYKRTTEELKQAFYKLFAGVHKAKVSMSSQVHQQCIPELKRVCL